MLLLLLKYIILLISLKMVFSANATTADCPLYTWQCNNGQCIKSEELCDGDYDCEDKSDETVEECLLRPCPNFAFQCAYGACITGNFKCNGVVNCVDGSDETRYLCKDSLYYEKELQGLCRDYMTMQCGSGECISNEMVCDGQTDCRDGSDETVEICSFLKCPEYSFRCGYGACITGTSACNGIRDCRDGSDEIASICSSIITANTTHIPEEPSYTTTVRPTNTTATIPIQHTSTTSERPWVTNNHCSASILMRGISSEPTCYYKNREVSCTSNIQSGTTANITCASGYVEKGRNGPIKVSKCDPDGEWTLAKRKCMPECGTLTDDQKESLTKPWEVTIFKRDLVGSHNPMCSGAIVSPKVVLTAGNCFRNGNGTYDTDHIFYSLIQGYYNRFYSNDYYIDAEVHNISRISIKTKQKMESLAVIVVVNFFQFSNNLKPICLPSPQSNPFTFYNEERLNIGRPIIHDTTKIYLEYLIASLELRSNGYKELTYVNIDRFTQFINREIKKYDYLL